jgi:hypothetical protein
MHEYSARRIEFDIGQLTDVLRCNLQQYLQATLPAFRCQPGPPRRGRTGHTLVRPVQPPCQRNL